MTTPKKRVVKLSSGAKEVLYLIIDAYAGIATRTNLEMEWRHGGDGKKLSRTTSELRRKGYIKVFRSVDPSDRFIYEATAKAKKVTLKANNE